MNNASQEKTVAGNQEIGRPEYCPPLVRVMSEAEVLSVRAKITSQFLA